MNVNNKIFKRFLFVILLLAAIVSPSATVHPDEKDNKLDLSGTWTAFLQNRGEIVFRTAESYIFKNPSSWSIQHKKEKPVEQGRFVLAKQTVYLYMKNKDGKQTTEAIPAKVVDHDHLKIDNPFDQQTRLIIVRNSSLHQMSKENICGGWVLFQKNLETKEVRESPYKLELLRNNTYTLSKASKKVTEIWGHGTWEIQNGFLYLKNEAKDPDVGFWLSPVFFFINGKLIYNNSALCVWAERAENKKEN